MSLVEAEYEAKRVAGSGVRLNLVSAGPRDGRVVVLLHGFPEFWWGWRKQIGPLAEAGFRVLAPDMRGYGGSDAPQAIADYRLDLLIADVVALIEGEGRGRCVLVGHDWGGVIAWGLAARRPDLVERLVILNAPHLDAGSSFLLRHPTQILRSAYIGFFQLPVVSEAALRAGGYALLVRLLTASSRPGVFGKKELDRYAREWDRPGRLTAMLSYYRALLRHRPRRLGRIAPKTLVLWGKRDAALSFELAQASLDHCADARLVSFEGATHWLHLEEPEAVNARILDFAGSTGGR
jgi:epoxide hydrolase 4